MMDVRQMVSACLAGSSYNVQNGYKYTVTGRANLAVITCRDERAIVGMRAIVLAKLHIWKDMSLSCTVFAISCDTFSVALK